jgi:hypothetical protein
MIRYGSLSLVFALGVLLAVSGGAAARTTAYSGTVVAIDPEDGVLTFDEVGPWRVTQGRTVVTRRTVAITPDTSFNTFIRVNSPGGFAGDFVQVALDAGNVTAGDFVTAECVAERGRLIAVRVTLAELE